jgi:hypothetical protein
VTSAIVILVALALVLYAFTIPLAIAGLVFGYGLTVHSWTWVLGSILGQFVLVALGKALTEDVP